ncbi:hypothetical protein SMICM304S_04917 [Streptomyces microflavus]
MSRRCFRTIIRSSPRRSGDPRHAPLLVTEAMRQAAMLAFHAGYGVPVGYHF